MLTALCPSWMLDAVNKSSSQVHNTHLLHLLQAFCCYCCCRPVPVVVTGAMLLLLLLEACYCYCYCRPITVTARCSAAEPQVGQGLLTSSCSSSRRCSSFTALCCARATSTCALYAASAAARSHCAALSASPSSSMSASCQQLHQLFSIPERLFYLRRVIPTLEI